MQRDSHHRAYWCYCQRIHSCYRFALFCLAFLLALFASQSAHAACSTLNYADKVWLNEYFFGSGGSAPPNFLEVYSTSPSFPASWQGWSIDLYSGLNSVTTYPLNNNTATACTVSNKTWLTTNVPSGLRSQNALVLLKDAAGNYVDAFVFNNTAPPAPWPGNAASSWFPGLADPTTGCPALANALTTQAGLSGTNPKQNNMLILSNFGNKDMARDPDGGSRWDVTSNTGSGTTYTQCVSNNANFNKTVDNALPVPGSTVTFTLSVSNTGNQAMSGVQVVDYLPPVLSFVSAIPTNPSDPAPTTQTYTTTDPNTGQSMTATQVNWSLASVATGTTSRLNIKMQVPANAVEGYSYVNTAQTTAGLSVNQSDFANITIGSPNTPSFVFSVEPASATTCTPALLGPKVTITAMSAANGGGTVLTSYNGTATLTASTPTVKWHDSSGTQLAGNTVTFSNGTATLYLTNTSAETVTVSATDVAFAAPNVMQGSSGNINFSSGTNSLTLTDVDLLTPAYGAVAGRPHAVRATLSTCGSSSTTSGTFTANIQYLPGLNNPATAAVPAISTNASCTSPITASASSPGTSFPLTFSGGLSTFYLCTTDVGQYALSLRVALGGNTNVTGVSPNFTVRPFVITATNFAAGATSNTGLGTTPFTAAGNAFSGTLRAWRWVPSADTESSGRGNGIPDAGVTAAAIVTANPGLTASFAGTTNNAGVVNLGAVQPQSGYVAGTLTPASATLSAGSATLANAFSYSEVGNLRVGGSGGSSVAASNYLGLTGHNVPILSDLVGRFVPHHFLATLDLLTRRLSCAAPTFTYMGEPFQVRFLLQARNASSVVTQNYRGLYAYLDPALANWTSTATVANGSFGLAAFNGATDLSSRLTLSSATSPLGWIAGTNTITANLRFSRDASGPVAPLTNIALGIVPKDSDGVTVRASDLNLNATRVQLATNTFRHGRLRLFSKTVAAGSTMQLPVQTQYWTGLSWLLSSDDNCTTIPKEALLLNNAQDNKGSALASGVWPSSVATDVTITGGNGAIQLTKPGAVSAGSVSVCADLGADPTPGVACAATAADRTWLKGQWAPGTGHDNDPSARATFGVYDSQTKRTVHVRELF